MDDDDDWPIPEQSQSIKNLFTEAKRSYNNRDYDTALEWYYRILQQARATSESPESVYAFIKSLYMISRCHLEKGLYKEASYIVDDVCGLVFVNCPDNIHITEQLLIEIEQRRGDLVSSFILAMIFKELHLSNNKSSAILYNVQSQLEKSLTQEDSDINQMVFFTLMVKGRSFYTNQEISLATAFFNKIIEMFQYRLPEENLQEAHEWREKCLGFLLEENASQSSNAQEQHQNSSSTNRHPAFLQKDTEVEGDEIISRCTRKDKSLLPEPTWEGLPSQPNTNEQLPNNSQSTCSNYSTSLHSLCAQSSTKGNEERTSTFCTSEENSNKTPGIESEDLISRYPEIPSDDEVSVCSTATTDSISEAPYEDSFITIDRRRRRKTKMDTFTLPEGVEVICFHFTDSSTPGVCPGCEKISKYVYWNKLSKKWTSIRKVPGNISASMTIKDCHGYQRGKKCKINCTYAHGPELQMWNLEIQGDLPSPEKYLRNQRKRTTSSKPRKKQKKAGQSGHKGLAHAQSFYNSSSCSSSNNNNNNNSNNNNNNSSKQSMESINSNAAPGKLVSEGQRGANAMTELLEIQLSTDRSLATKPNTLAQPGVLNMTVLNQNTDIQRPSLPDEAVKREDLRLCESVEPGIFCSKTSNEEKNLQTQVPLKTIKHHELKLTESIPGVKLSCSPATPNVQLQLAEDRLTGSCFTWVFCVQFKADQASCFPRVQLQYHRQHFYISKVQGIGYYTKQGRKVAEFLIPPTPMKKDHFQPTSQQWNCNAETVEFRADVTFRSMVSGSFVQRILLNFGTEPFLTKEFSIDIGSRDTLERLRVARAMIDLKVHPWDRRDMRIIRCDPNPENENLMSTFALPNDVERIVSIQQVEKEIIRQDTYKQTMHQLLFTEEVHMRNLLLRLTPTNSKLRILKSLDLGIGGVRFPKPGQVFGSIERVCTEITPDDVVGRLCLRNVQSVFIKSRDDADCLYEVSIAHLESRKVTVNLTPEVRKELKIEEEDDSAVDVCMRFQLNRIPHCIMHKAIESLGGIHIRQLFPAEQPMDSRKPTRKAVTIQWQDDSLDPRLNDCQKSVIQAIAQAVPPSPPLVVFGPFGTGKTFTLNQAVRYLVRERANRVLLCTHTNSAADIHVEMLDKYLSGNTKVRHTAKPLRIYALETQVNRTSSTAQKYALIEDGTFLMPTKRNILEHRVVITTLVTADLLSKLDEHERFFSHILIDEAAQAWETESLIPIALAGPDTKIVFTGDHMQMNPEVYSKFAYEKGLQKSLPERLFDHYKNAKDASFKDENIIFLLENFRSNKDILDFPSKHYFGGKIIAQGHEDNPSHPQMGSLSFYATRGEDQKQYDNSYLNAAEVNKTVELVNELIKTWPECWGEKKLQDVAVLAAYSFQVRAIRNRLRDKGLGQVNVETIHNVQGKEFRALFISTVRTTHSITTSQRHQDHCEDLSLEFLTDPKLLITAVTRAKSLVAVVGDPIALCTLGKCRHLWMDYIFSCSNLKGLHGTTWLDLTKEIRGSQSSVTLNPTTASFVPRSKRQLNHEKEDSDTDALDSSFNSALGNSSLAEDSRVSSRVKDAEHHFEDHDDHHTREVDEIIKAFVKKCQEREDSEAEFPPLSSSNSVEHSSNVNTDVTANKRTKSAAIDKETLQCDYLIRRKNGREEILLLDLYKNRPKYSKEVALNSNKQDLLGSKELERKLKEDPSRYVTAQLQIGSDRLRTTYAVVEDKRKSDILVKGHVTQAFDGDTVVIDFKRSALAIEANVGFFIGVLNHLIEPHERQCVCKVDTKNPAVMVPINRSVPKIINVTDRTCNDIPVYEKNEHGPLIQVNLIAMKEVLDKKHLFVVRFLKWKKGHRLPLGCAVETIPTGETLDKAMKILHIEFGIREPFTDGIQGMIQQSLPDEQQIQNEINSREKISNAFTIDPAGSRDLDDAVSIERTRDGNFKIGIHIADVSFYVRRGSKLDEEARKRGVTYYPVREGEAKIHMLPEELSEERLSLLPDEDRLTISVFVTLNNKGRVINDGEVCRTVTRSCCRLTYSDAQKIIDGEAVPGVPDQVYQHVRLFYSLTVKTRWLRLGEASHDHSNQREDTDAHELIEELMILVNHTVGELLHRGNPMGTPFRIQPEPKVHRLNEWASKYGAFAKYSPGMKPLLESDDITSEVKEKIESQQNIIFVQKKVWDQIREAARCGNCKRIERLMYDPFCSPQIVISHQNLKRIQCKSRYQSSVPHPHHYSLKISNYVHFSSPIRRYIDIEVHRLLLRAEHYENEQLLSEDDMAKLCQRTTFVQDNSRKYERESKRVHFASELKRRNHAGIFVIGEIEEHSFTIQSINPDEEHLYGNHMKIKFDDLSLHSKTDSEDEKQETTLEWRFRMYIAPPVPQRNVDKQHPKLSDKESPSLSIDAETIKKMTEAKYESQVYKVKGKTWMAILDTIKNSSPEVDEKLLHYVEDTVNEMQEMKTTKKKEPLKGKRVVYKHPNYGKQKNSKQKDGTNNTREDEGHFYKTTLNLKQYDLISVQLFSRVHRGILHPDDQFFKISPDFGICLEHRKDPKECFAYTVSRHVDSRNIFDSIHQYVQRWKPPLRMEAATGAVRQNNELTLKSLTVVWSQTDKKVINGMFTLTKSYCESRQIIFHPGDLTCVKILCGATGIHESSVLSDDTAPVNTSMIIWIGHGLIQRSDWNKERDKITVTFAVPQMASEFPQEHVVCDLQLIYQPLPLRRMMEALTKLKKCSELVKKICLGNDITEGTFPLLADKPLKNLSLAVHYETSGFQNLNRGQQQAVRMALENSFLLIQGPPGTGKTVTGIHIAYWFAKKNGEQEKLRKEIKKDESPETPSSSPAVEPSQVLNKSVDVVPSPSPSPAVEPSQVLCGPSNKSVDVVTPSPSPSLPSPPLAPPKVLYCGPSNKSVNVVTEYLLRIPEMKNKILRVHSTLIQETEFPIPNKIKISNVSKDELKIPEEKVKEVSLHHIIRREPCPYAKELEKLEKKFAEAEKKEKRPSDKEVEEYCSIISKAETWAIQETGKEIILCTCCRAGSSTITRNCNNIQQCIIDECGMCMEPEALVPMTSSKAKQFVLIGDHKQLQPVVTDTCARNLGLEVSMFERLAENAYMLKEQYRMHPSICEFPSCQFYDGKLETPQSVRYRPTTDVKIWPALDKDLRIVFCHIKGEEKTSVISTAESGVDSKYNDKEAMKAVQVAKYLVNTHKTEIKQKNVVILTPYRKQRKIVKDLLKGAYEDILVTTIIKSQGSEWDYVIISLVRSLPEEDLEPDPSSSWITEHLGFITDDHQINVALTRAKHGLCIIGNKNLLECGSATWRDLIKHYSERNCVVNGEQWPK